MKLSAHEVRVLAVIEDDFRLHDPAWLERFDEFAAIGRGREGTARRTRRWRLRNLSGILLLALLIAVPLTPTAKGALWAPLDGGYGQVMNVTASAAAALGTWAGDQAKGAEARACQAAGTVCG